MHSSAARLSLSRSRWIETKRWWCLTNHEVLDLVYVHNIVMWKVYCMLGLQFWWHYPLVSLLYHWSAHVFLLTTLDKKSCIPRERRLETLGARYERSICKKCIRLWNCRKLQLWLLFCYLILVKACTSIRPLVTKQRNATTQVCNLLNQWGPSVLDNCVRIQQQCWALQ